MLRLHDSLSSGNGFKVRLLLTQLGMPFERVEYDLDRRATRTPEFLPRNPNGRVPVLELEDGSFLAESNAILWYLADSTPFLPDAGERRQRAEVLQWMFFEQYSHEPNIATVRFWITHGTPVTPLIELSMPAKRAQGEAALAVMDGIFDSPVLRRRALHHRGHRALRLHPRGGGSGVRPLSLPRRARLDKTGLGAAGLPPDHPGLSGDKLRRGCRFPSRLASEADSSVEIRASDPLSWYLWARAAPGSHQGAPVNCR